MRQTFTKLAQNLSISGVRDSLNSMASTAMQRFNFIGDIVDSEEESGSEEGWIRWFCSQPGHEFLCEVDFDYIKDSFNLYGLRGKVNNFDGAMQMILGFELNDTEDLVEYKALDLYNSATELYNLIHCRFIFSPHGLSIVNQKFKQRQFGTCPRVYCNEQPVLPIGRSDAVNTQRVQLYCPCCQECFESKSCLDGAAFGPFFPAMFLNAFPSCIPRTLPVPFVPKLFGFRIANKKSIIECKLEKGKYGIIALEEHEERKRKLLTQLSQTA